MTLLCGEDRNQKLYTSICKCLSCTQFYFENERAGKQKYKNLELEDLERSSRRVVCRSGEVNDSQK